MDETPQKLRAGGAAPTCSHPGSEWHRTLGLLMEGKKSPRPDPKPASGRRSQELDTAGLLFQTEFHDWDWEYREMPVEFHGGLVTARDGPLALGGPDPGIPNKPGLGWAGAPHLRAGTLWLGPRRRLGSPTHPCSILQIHEALWDLNPWSCASAAAPAGQRREFP